MKRTVLLSALILVAILTFGQTQNNDKNFDLGVEAFNSGNYEKAISYFTLSIDEVPASNAIVNRAISYYYIGDSCNFCADLRTASGMSDTTARKLFKENCIISSKAIKIPDSIKSKQPDAEHIEISYLKCSNDSIVTVFFRNDDRIWRKDISSIDGEVFTIVENMPEFPGGEVARNRFLAENIFYPLQAATNGIQGTVYVSFVVDENGDVIDAKVIRGIGGGCDEESLRVVNLMPKWKPGTQKGNPVRVLFNMPIYYTLQGPGIPKNRK
jgi:TonB family protein